MVVLDRPYDTLHRPATQALFGRLAAMKIAGYRRDFPGKGVLPFDDSEFVATHLMLCERVGGGVPGETGDLVPIMGYRSMSSDRARQHRVKFPALGVVSGEGLDAHRAVITRLSSEAEAANQPIAYNSALVVSDAVSKQAMPEVWRVVIAMFVFHYQARGIETVLAASRPGSSAEAAHRFVGFDALSDGTNVLSIFPSTPHFDERVQLWILRRMSTQANELAELFRPMWESRTEISVDDGLDPRQ